MNATILHLAYGMLTLSLFLGLFRLWRGPTVIDRIMAFDLITTSAVGMIILLSIQWRTPMFLEVILIFSLLGFFGTVAFVFYLHRSYEVEEEPLSRTPDKPKPAPSHE